jgi:plasmid replication initiation protein
MEIEDIAKVDLYLRMKNGKQNLLQTEALIIIENDPQAVNKLKEAAYKLNEIDNHNVAEEIKQTWHNLFTKQLRFSVARAKEKRKS